MKLGLQLQHLLTLVSHAHMYTHKLTFHGFVLCFIYAGTHDVQDLHIHALNNIDQFNSTVTEVTCSYLTGSTTSGIFVTVQSQTNGSDVHYVVGERSVGNQTRVIIDGLSGGVYNVIVYDRGEDQLPEVRPAGSQTVYIKNQHSMNAGAFQVCHTLVLNTECMNTHRHIISIQYHFFRPPNDYCNTLVTNS